MLGSLKEIANEPYRPGPAWENGATSDAIRAGAGYVTMVLERLVDPGSLDCFERWGKS
jgi:hypothetical protein